MEKLEIAGTETTPSILFDPKENQFTIEGRSLMEDVSTYYKPMQDWFIEYQKKPNQKTELNIRLEYLNTATSRKFLDVFNKLQEIPGSKVIWHFLDEDDDMEEIGQELAELVTVPFELRAN